jgi:hypothetical protein
LTEKPADPGACVIPPGTPELLPAHPLAAPAHGTADHDPRLARVALADLDERSRTGSGYSAEHGEQPSTFISEVRSAAKLGVAGASAGRAGESPDPSATEPVLESALSQLSRAKVRVSRFRPG